MWWRHQLLPRSMTFSHHILICSREKWLFVHTWWRPRRRVIRLNVWNGSSPTTSAVTMSTKPSCKVEFLSIRFWARHYKEKWWPGKSYIVNKFRIIRLSLRIRSMDRMKHTCSLASILWRPGWIVPKVWAEAKSAKQLWLSKMAAFINWRTQIFLLRGFIPPWRLCIISMEEYVTSTTVF